MTKLPQDQTAITPPDTPAPLDEKRWFEDEVHTHDARLKAYLRNAFPTIDVEDIVQESYLRTWRAHAASPLTSAKSFLFTVARRLALNSSRHKKKSPITFMPNLALLRVCDEGRNAAETAATNDDLALLQEAIAALPPRIRQIIILCKIQHVPQRVIARRFGISEVTVQEQVYRGIRRMEAFFIRRGAIKPW